MGLPIWAIILIIALVVVVAVRIASKLIRLALGVALVVFGIFFYLNHYNVSKTFDDTKNITLSALNAFTPAAEKLKQFAAQNVGYDVKKVSDDQYVLTDKDGLKVTLEKNGDKTHLIGQAPRNNPAELKKLATILEIYIHPTSSTDLAAQLSNASLNASTQSVDLPQMTVSTDGPNLIVKTK